MGENLNLNNEIIPYKIFEGGESKDIKLHIGDKYYVDEGEWLRSTDNNLYVRNKNTYGRLGLNTNKEYLTGGGGPFKNLNINLIRDPTKFTIFISSDNSEIYQRLVQNSEPFDDSDYIILESDDYFSVFLIFAATSRWLINTNQYCIIDETNNKTMDIYIYKNSDGKPTKYMIMNDNGKHGETIDFSTSKDIYIPISQPFISYILNDPSDFRFVTFVKNTKRVKCTMIRLDSNADRCSSWIKTNIITDPILNKYIYDNISKNPAYYESRKSPNYDKLNITEKLIFTNVYQKIAEYSTLAQSTINLTSISTNIDSMNYYKNIVENDSGDLTTQVTYNSVTKTANEWINDAIAHQTNTKNTANAIIEKCRTNASNCANAAYRGLCSEDASYVETEIATAKTHYDICEQCREDYSKYDSPSTIASIINNTVGGPGHYNSLSGWVDEVENRYAELTTKHRVFDILRYQFVSRGQGTDKYYIFPNSNNPTYLPKPHKFGNGKIRIELESSVYRTEYDSNYDYQMDIIFNLGNNNTIKLDKSNIYNKTTTIEVDSDQLSKTNPNILTFNVRASTNDSYIFQGKLGLSDNTVSQLYCKIYQVRNGAF